MLNAWFVWSTALAIAGCVGYCFASRHRRLHMDKLLFEKYKSMTGTFAGPGGIMYYRECLGVPAIPVELVRVTASGAEWQPIRGTKLECALPGSRIARVSQEAPPKFVGFVHHEDGSPAGVCWRYDDVLIMARHELEGISGGVIVRTARGHAVVPEGTVWHRWACTSYEYTGADIVAAKLPQQFFAKVGLAAATRKHLTKGVTPSITTYGLDMDGVATSTGRVSVEKSHAMTKRGLFAHTASTVPGFSGCPIIGNKDGHVKILGMHVCGDLEGSACNYALGVSVIQAFLRDMGLVKFGPTVGDLCESLDTGMSQSENGTIPDHETDFRFMTEAEYQEMISGAVEWERERDAIADQVGFGHVDAGTRSKKNRKRSDFNDSIKPEPAPSLPKQLMLSHSCDKSPLEQAIVGVKVMAPGRCFVDNAAELYLQTGVRLWKRSDDDDGYTVFSANDAVRVDASVNDTRALFRAALEGNWQKVVEDAPKYNPESLLNCGAREGIGYEPLHAFIQYTEQTHHSVVYQDGDAIVDSKGNPQYRYRGRVKSGGRNSRKGEAAPLPDDLKAVMAKYGLNTNWTLPPDSQKSILGSLAAQAKEITIGSNPDFTKVYHRMKADSEFDLKPFSGNLDCLNNIGNSFEAKSSGWSARWQNLDKKSMWERHASPLVSIVVTRIILRCCYAERMMTMTPLERFQAGLSDPKVLGPKGEEHGEAKSSKGKWRQIWVMSTVDIMAQALTAKHLCNAEIERYQTGATHHFAMGLGHHPEGIARLGQAIEATFPSGKVVASDAKGWDGTVPPDQLLMAGHTMALTWRHNGRHDLSLLTMYDTFAHMGHVMLAGTLLLSSSWYGQTASGAVITTIGNNKMRRYGALACGCDATLTAGDDLLADKDIPPSELAKTGAVAKLIETPSGAASSVSVDWRKGEVLDFTSHDLWKDADGVWHARFKNLAKSMAHMLRTTKTPDEARPKLGSLMKVCRGNNEQMWIVESIARDMGWVVPPEGEWVEPELL